MRDIRYLSKLIDELAKGKAMDKIQRRAQRSVRPQTIKDGLLLETT